MIPLQSNPNVDNSDLVNYPNGRIKDNTGTGNGTPVNRNVYGDIHQTVAKLMRLYAIEGNGIPDNETNGFQIIQAIVALASKNDFVLPLSLASGIVNIPLKLEFMLENESVICKAGFNITTETQIKGSNATVFALNTVGSFKINEYVRLVKTGAGVTLVRLFDSVNVLNLDTRLVYLENSIAVFTQKLSIFTVGGVMFAWNKEIIPSGFQEVTDFRGKTIFGKDAAQTEFALMGIGITPLGSKNAILVSHTHNVSGTAGSDSGGGAFTTGAQNEGGGNYGISTEGVSGVGKNLPPYGVVKFIEWATT